MSGINKVILVGRLGGDTELKMAGSTPVANFSLATSEKYKDKQTGELKEVSEWHRVVLFNRLAEIASQYLSKGSMVYIEGKIKTEKYTDKEGVERYATKIIANNLQMLDSKNKNQDVSEKVNAKHSAQEEVFNDDIPF